MKPRFHLYLPLGVPEQCEVGVMISTITGLNLGLLSVAADDEQMHAMSSHDLPLASCRRDIWFSY
jgi:hypothetical protein